MGKDEGWVKLPRSLLDFGWFDDSQTAHVYLYLLLNARTEAGIYHERTIRRGQLATSVAQIAAATHASTRAVRTALDRLKKANLITIESTPRYSVVTITDYQSEEPRHRPKAVSDYPQADTPRPASVFTPPTLSEVREFFEERGFKSGGTYWNRVSEIENFYYYYQSKGWMVGQNPMTDWKASATNWIRKSANGTQTRNYAGSRDLEKEKRDNDFAALIQGLASQPPP